MNKLKRTAAQFISNYMKFVCIDGQQPEHVVGELMNILRDIRRKSSGSKVPSLVFLAAPSLISESSSKTQHAINENMNSATVCICPQFTYMKGNCFQDELAMIQKLTSANHHIDTQFAMPLTNKTDARDRRNMIYMGRVVFPSPLGDIQKSPFWHCDLVQRQCTEDIYQLNPACMKDFEDLSPSALPPSTDGRDGHIKGAKKAVQMGLGGWEALLKSCLMADDLNNPGFLSHVGTLHIMDVFPHVGELMEVFCKNRNGYAVNLYYTCLTENQVEDTRLEKDPLA